MSLFSNLVTSLFSYGHICTTLPKAKELRSIADKIISLGKSNTVHSRRLANKTIRNKTILKKIFNEIAPSYLSNTGGVTRIIHKGVRKGDAAPICIIELV